MFRWRQNNNKLCINQVWFVKRQKIRCNLDCKVERTVILRTNSSCCNNTSCALVYIYTVLQQDHMSSAATAQQETRAVWIQLQYPLMQSEHSNHNHRYLSSPAHPYLINKVNNTECARRESADGCNNTNDERFIIVETLSWHF